MPMIGKWLAFILLFASIHARAEEARVIGTFSNLEFIEESGDLVGMEIKIVPTGDRYQAAVIVSEGAPNAMVVVDVRVDGTSIEFEVPAADAGWKFSGRVTAKSLSGMVTYASGQTEKVILPRQCGYWDR